MVDQFPKQKIKLGIQRYDVTAKSTSANLLLQENSE